MIQASTSAQGQVLAARTLPWSYRAGLMAAAVVMLLLPALYLVFIAVVAVLVGLWVVYGVVFAGFSVVGVVLYVAPVVAGVILVIFMLKPFFLRPPKSGEPMLVDLAANPKLVAYVAGLCRTVGAPMPSEIRVDCNVNASASFQRGWLGLLRRRLTLTLGLPLLATLDAQDLAVVVAHEFGHFAQRGAMGATFLVNSVNLWFARVVYQRDRMDLWLERLGDTRGWSVQLIATLAKAGVRLGRRLLLLLMKLGHASCCYLLRQMEYDADWYAVHALGVEAFLRTNQQMGLLLAANGRAQADLGAMWREKRLVDDLPALVTQRRATLPDSIQAELRKAVEAQKPKWSDTHPTTMQREEHAKTLGVAGLLRFEGPARDLLADFTGLCREATWHHYTVALRVPVNRAALTSTDAVTRVGDQRQREVQALATLAPGLIDSRRPLVLAELDRPEEELRRLLADQRAKLRERRKDLGEAQADFNRHALAWDNAHAARSFMGVGLKVMPGSFDLLDSTEAAAELRLASAERAREEARARLAPADDALALWFSAGVALGRLIAAREVQDDAGRAASELLGVEKVFRALAPLMGAIPEIHRRHFVLRCFCANGAKLGKNLAFRAELARQREGIDALIAGQIDAVRTLELPAAMGDRTLTVGEFFDLDTGAHDPYVRAQIRASAVYELHGRLLGQLAASIERLEAPAGHATAETAA